MTYAEAIEILKERRMCAAYVDSEYVDSVDIEAIDIAISSLEKQEQKKPLTVLSCGDDVTPIKCTGMKCPMQAGKVDPATCKAADTCEWATKPMTNADKIRLMTDEELARMFLSCDDHVYRPCPSDTIAEYRQIRPASECYDCTGCWLGWLKQEINVNEL